MPQTEAQVVPREVQQAVHEVTTEILRILGDAGVDISRPNTPEGRRLYLKELRDKKIDFQKIISADRPDMSGTGIFKAGIQIGFIPALGVVGGGKKVIV